jgi:hypothetical protein
VKILFDRLLIGALLVAAGLWANYLLERYKQQEGFRTELNKTRVERIGEVWESLYVYEAAVDNLLDRFRVIIVEAKTERDEMKRKRDELPPLIKSQADALAELVVISHRNRFWIGEDVYVEVTGYSGVLADLIDAYLNYDVQKIEAINNKRARLRKGVRSVRDKLLGE